jgi:hypothetical protein
MGYRNSPTEAGLSPELSKPRGRGEIGLESTSPSYEVQCEIHMNELRKSCEGAGIWNHQHLKKSLRLSYGRYGSRHQSVSTESPHHGAGDSISPGRTNDLLSRLKVSSGVGRVGTSVQKCIGLWAPSTRD